MRVRGSLEIDHEPHPFAPARVVLDIRDVLDPSGLHEVRDLLREPRLVHLVRQLGDDDPRSAGAPLLDGADTPDLDGASPGLVRVTDPVLAQHDAAGREIGALDELPQLRRRGLRVIDEMDDRIDHLTEVVRRDVRGHPNRDPPGTVHQQVRESGGKHDRLLLVPIEVRLEVDGLGLDVPKELQGHGGKPSFRVPVRCGRVAVDGAEVPVSVHQGGSKREVLGHPHQGVVDRVVPVRVVLPDHVADDRRRLAVGTVGPEAGLEHRPEDPAVHRLQTVTHLGQRASDDHGHRVVEVRPLDLVFQLDGLDVPCEQAFLRHGCS